MLGSLWHFNKGIGQSNHNGQNLKVVTASESYSVRTVAGIPAKVFSFLGPSPLSPCFSTGCSVKLRRVLGDHMTSWKHMAKQQQQKNSMDHKPKCFIFDIPSNSRIMLSLMHSSIIPSFDQPDSWRTYGIKTYIDRNLWISVSRILFVLCVSACVCMCKCMAYECVLLWFLRRCWTQALMSGQQALHWVGTRVWWGLGFLLGLPESEEGHTVQVSRLLAFPESFLRTSISPIVLLYSITHFH